MAVRVFPGNIGQKTVAAIRYWNQHGKPPGTHHAPRELGQFFDRLELVEPGLVSCTRWRAEATPFGEP